MKRLLLGATAFVAFLVASARPVAAEEVYATVGRTAAPGERAVVSLRADAPGPATVVLYRVEDPETLLAAGPDAEGPLLHVRLRGAIARALEGAAGKVAPFAPLAAAPRAVVDAAGPAIDARLTFVSVKGTDLAKVADGSGAREVDVALPASGLYLVEVRKRGVAAVATALSSRLALVTKRDRESLLAWAVDRATGTPIANVAVEARAGGKALAAGTTDAKGLARLAVRGSPTLEVRARLGDDLAFGAETYYPADVSDRRVYAFPHQPAYRPGERVEAKGVVRAWRDGAYALDAEATAATLRFLAPGDREMGAATAAVSADLGTFAGGFDLPKDAPTGDWTLRVDVGGKGYAAPFRVEEYRKPTFEVTVRAEPGRVFAGGDVAFDVEASLFEGGPVAGGEVQWTASFLRVDRDLFPTDELARLFFGSEREAYAPVAVATGTTRLDAKGRARIAAKAPATKEDGFLSLRATVIGPDRTAVGGSGSAAVAATPLTVAVRTDKHLYGPEATARASVLAVLADGRPAAGREGVLLVARATEGPTGTEEERATGSFPFRTDERGAAAVDVVFSANGRYTISVAIPRASDEPAGPPAHAEVHAWVAGEHADVGVSGDRLEVIADKDAYAVGDVARLLVLSPVGARPFLSTLEGARIAEATTVDLGGRADRAAGTVIEVRIGPEHSPAAYVGVCVVDQGNAMTTAKLVRVPPVERLLRPVVTPAKTEIDPGESVPMTVSVTDAAGKPAAGAEVAVAVVDDALYALYADPAAAIEPFFHAVRRNDVRTGGPLQHASVGWGVLFRESKEGRDGGAPPAAEGEMPPPRPGEVPAPARHGGRNLGPSSPAGPPPAAPAPAPLPAPEPVPDPATGAGPGSAGDDGEETLSRARASLESDGKKRKDDAGEGPLEARADFRSAVWWSPSVRVGPDGTASIGPVPFAQSLTRWRITARAVDGATRVGTGVTTVRTAKKVATRVTLPRFLRATDRVSAPWLLHNLTEADVAGRFVARAEGVSLSGPTEGEATIRAGEVLARELSVTAPSVGPASVVAELRTGAGSDAMRVSIPVLPQGIPKTLAASAWTEDGAVTLPALVLPRTAEPRTERLTITVAPSYAQAVGAALPYLADYPYGCTEQTMSRLLPVIVAKAATDAFRAPLRGRLAELPAMLDAGIARLRALQHPDGGFGWWAEDASDPYMTAYVLHGLSRAMPAMADPAPAKALADRAGTWLLAWARKPDERPEGTWAFALMALADAGVKGAEALLPAAVGDGTAVTPVPTRVFLLRAAAALRRTEDVRIHLENLLLHAERGREGVHFGRGDAGVSRWSDDAVETTAWAMGAILSADPKHPDLAGGARWLLSRRSDGARWNSTRDTAACVAFLTRLSVASGDAGAGRRVEVSLNGTSLGAVEVTLENAFTDAATLVVPADALPKGAPLEVGARTASGTAAVSAALSFTETGPAIEAAAAGFTVARAWSLLVPKTRADGTVDHVATPWTETVPSGALVEVEVVVESAEAREFAMVTSPHPAGFEPERRWIADEDRESAVPPGAVDHVETRDDRTVFFVKALPRGRFVFRHVMRATHVGAFTALPAQAELMYFPTVRGNSKGEVIEVNQGAGAGRVAPGEGGR